MCISENLSDNFPESLNYDVNAVALIKSLDFFGSSDGIYWVKIPHCYSSPYPAPLRELAELFREDKRPMTAKYSPFCALPPFNHFTKRTENAKERKI